MNETSGLVAGPSHRSALRTYLPAMERSSAQNRRRGAALLRGVDVHVGLGVIRACVVHACGLSAGDELAEVL